MAVALGARAARAAGYAVLSSEQQNGKRPIALQLENHDRHLIGTPGQWLTFFGEHFFRAEIAESPGRNDQALFLNYSFASPGVVGAYFLSYDWSDCSGADYLAFDIRVSKPAEPTGGDMFTRIGIFDGKICENKAGPNNGGFDQCGESEVYLSDFIPLDQLQVDEWLTVRIDLNSGEPGSDAGFTRYTGDNSGVADNLVLDTNRLKGFKVDIIFEPSGDGDGDGDGEPIVFDAAGHFFFDNLRCEGPWVFGASLFEPNVAVAGRNTYYNGVNDPAQIAKVLNLTFDNPGRNGSMTMEYHVEKGASWGGTVNTNAVVGGVQDFDLTGAGGLRFYYNNLRPQNPPRAAHFRFQLFDDSDCSNECYLAGNVEVYFSLQFILDEETGWKTIEIPFEVGDDVSFPFARTGWVGIHGNRKLDLDRIKGYAIEISVDSSGQIGDFTEGMIAIGGLHAVETVAPGDDFDGTLDITEGLAVIEGHYALRELASSICDTECAEDERCYWFAVNDRDCLMYNASISPSQINLRTSLHQRFTHKWIFSNDGETNPVACDSCLCSEDVVDCSDERLPGLVPRFNHSTATKLVLPQSQLVLPVLALNEMSQLSHLDATKAENLRFISTEQLPSSLKTIDANWDSLINLVTDPLAAFDNVCCDREALEGVTTSDGRQLYRCRDVVDSGSCLDCTIEPEVNYADESLPLAVIEPDSLFGDGALSYDACGELCERTRGCLYFTWDARSNLANPRCFLRTNGASRTSNSYEYVSGFNSLARAMYANATVSIASSDGVVGEVGDLSPENDFSMTYTVRLGAQPTRGAVWVRPQVRLFGLNDMLTVKISPETVVIYRDDWEAPHEVTISVVVDENTPRGGVRAEVKHEIEACDEAFMQLASEVAAELTRQFDVSLVKPEVDRNVNFPLKVVCWGLCLINICVAITFFFWTLVNRQHPVVKASQTIFLAMIALGGVVSSLTILAITFDDEGDDEGLAATGDYLPANYACMAMVWFYSLGFVITLAPLFAKTWRLAKIVNRKDLKRFSVPSYQVFAICLFLVVVDAVIILTWTLLAPLKYYRINVAFKEDPTSPGGLVPVESIGKCRTDGNEVPFIVVLVCFHLGVLLYGNYICAQIKVLKHTVLSEGKHLRIAMFSYLQVLALAVPVLIIMVDEPVAWMVVGTGVIFLNDLSCMCLFFVPKIRAVRRGVGVTSSILPFTGGSSSGSKGAYGNDNSTSTRPTMPYHVHDEFSSLQETL